MAKSFKRSDRISTRTIVLAALRYEGRKAKPLSPIVLSSLIQAISRSIVALVS